MESPETQAIQQNATPIGPVKPAIICLVLAWFFALIPIPLISFGGMIVFNIAAFILAIICMSKNAVKPGVGVLAGSIIGTPIMYFIGLSIGLSIFGWAGLNAVSKLAAPQIQNHPAPVVQPAAVEPAVKSTSAETTLPAATADVIDINGNWQGTYESHGHTPTPFSMVINKPNNGAFDGSASEQISSAGAAETIQSKLNGTINTTAVVFIKEFSFKGKSYSVRYIGTYDPITERIQGKWKGLTGNSHGSFLVWR